MSLIKARFKSHLAIRVAQSWFVGVLERGSIHWNAEHGCKYKQLDEYNDHTVVYNIETSLREKGVQFHAGTMPKQSYNLGRLDQISSRPEVAGVSNPRKM